MVHVPPLSAVVVGPWFGSRLCDGDRGSSFPGEPHGGGDRAAGAWTSALRVLSSFIRAYSFILSKSNIRPYLLQMHLYSFSTLQTRSDSFAESD